MLREVKTENGRVRGISAADPRIISFKGIPFAAPPVGDLRWRAPRPAANWDGVRNCYMFAPIAMQKIPDFNPDDPKTNEWNLSCDTSMSEDCLYLNVWTPAKSADEKLPVMLWIHGGAFNYGATSECQFDGERIARRGLVVVSISYRLGLFAWLAHPDMKPTEPNGPKGNFGFLDQMQGMQWVQKNIAAFGGDPDNVTVFGQSAGAGSILAHLVSHRSRGLYHKAIVMSGGGIRECNSVPNNTRAQQEDIGVKFQEFLGYTSYGDMKSIDAETLLQKGVEFGKQPGAPKFPFMHYTDGWFLEKDWTEAQLENDRNMVPIMAGHTTNDFRWPPFGVKDMATLKAYAEKSFGDRTNEYLKLIDFDKGDYEASMKKVCIPMQELGSANWMEYNARMGNAPIYGYTFDGDMPGDDQGAFHAADLWFVFETLAKSWRPFTAKHYDLARKICNYWTNFAKTGNPNGIDTDGRPQPEWKPYTLDNPYEIYFGDTIRMRDEQDPVMKFLVQYSLDWHKEHPYKSK